MCLGIYMSVCGLYYSMMVTIGLYVLIFGLRLQSTLLFGICNILLLFTS